MVDFYGIHVGKLRYIYRTGMLRLMALFSNHELKLGNVPMHFGPNKEGTQRFPWSLNFSPNKTICVSLKGLSLLLSFATTRNKTNKEDQRHVKD